DRELGHADRGGPVRRGPRQPAVGAAHGVLDAPRRRRHLHPAAGLRHLPEPAQRAPLPRRARRGAVRRSALRRVHDRPVRTGHPHPQLGSNPVVREAGVGSNHRMVRLIAIIAGLLGAALAIATPFLPVTQTTAQLNWPQDGVLKSVDAPLIGYVPTDLEISIPCSAAAPLAAPDMRGRTVLLSTVPKQA